MPSNASRRGRRDHAGASPRTGAPSRARGRGGVPKLSLEWSTCRPLLAGRGCQEHPRPIHVRQLEGDESGRGAAGKWTDAATGEHGDLLDVIRETRGLVDFHDVATEARRFLSLPRPEPDSASRSRLAPAPAGSAEFARRLFAMSDPVPGTLVETYLRARGITALPQTNSLRFHPRCYYRPDQYSPTETWPAMIAAVTDLGGRDHRRAPHLPCAIQAWLFGQRKGTDRHTAARDGTSSRQRRSLRHGR